MLFHIAHCVSELINWRSRVVAESLWVIARNIMSITVACLFACYGYI